MCRLQHKSVQTVCECNWAVTGQGDGLYVWEQFDNSEANGWDEPV